MSTESLKYAGIMHHSPSTDLLDQYQETVLSQIKYDENGQTIKGIEPLEYMHAGITEELFEPWEPERVYTDYDRLGSLLREMPHFSPGVVSEGALELHKKEFGDISWYMANRLSLQGIKLSTTITAGKAYHQHKIHDAKTASPEFIIDFEERFPALSFATSSYELETASRAAIDTPTQDTLDYLRATSGQLILSMCHVILNRFDTHYEIILEQNIAKINKRIKDGTIFDKSGGDAR
jgi:hypothetical protein